MPTADPLDLITSTVTPGLTFHDPSHTYRLNGKVVPSVTQIMRSLGIGPDFSQVPPDVLRRAAERGTEVHRLTAMMDRGEFTADTVFDPNYEGYLDGWARFLGMNEWEPMLIEEPLGSEEDDDAGTIDRFGILNGRPTILDLKTGLYHPSFEMQVNGGYRLLLIRNGIISEREDIVDRSIVKLKANGDWELCPAPEGLNHVVALEHWRYALTLYHTYKEA